MSDDGTLLTITQGAALIGWSRNALSKRRDLCRYFPVAVDYIPGPGGRTLGLYRRSDLIAYAQSRPKRPAVQPAVMSAEDCQLLGRRVRVWLAELDELVKGREPGHFFGGSAR